MPPINIQGVVKNISENNNTIYTPIVEAVVNSIESIEESGRTDGAIYITLRREQPSLLSKEDITPNITTIEIEDNGIGFTDKNRNSFDTLYSDLKLKSGGKGFGRFMFLKYFNQVRVNSTFKAGEKLVERTFSFSSKSNNVQSFIEEETTQEITNKETLTTITLENIKEKYSNKLEKKMETIARVLVEKLLPYFINDKYLCPQIILQEENSTSQIILNDYVHKHEGIKQLAKKIFTLSDGKSSEQFEVIIFKVYHTRSTSSVILTAHNRAVTSENLHKYIPEFDEDFYDTFDSSKQSGNKNFSIKAYVLANYLNKFVSLERGNFQFSNISDASKLLYPFSTNDIESKTASIIEEEFKDEMRSRKLKKRERVKNYIDSKAPWHKLYFDDLDLSSIPYQFDDTTIENKLQEQKYKKDQSIRTKVSEILKNEDGEVTQAINEISKDLTTLGKSDLAHYVVLRKAVLDILAKSLKWNKEKKYEKEKVVHELIFPMRSDSDHIPYDKHNLWLIDERLSFQEYVASDKPLKKNDRPDLLIFGRPIAVRDGDEPSNPITIFEFKKPQREEYEDDDNPLDQIVEYIEKIRKGDFKDIDGRIIKATEETPAYGFLVCDLTEKIRIFCKKYPLTISP
ncbi:MAG: hypothetical protein RI947_1555, partial [Candidatus Parcubacteria bacterium]